MPRKATKQPKVWFETSRFEIIVAIVNPKDDPIPQYIVVNKETGVHEFCNASLYFARDWAIQFTSALDKQDRDLAGEALEDLKQAILSTPTELN